MTQVSVIATVLNEGESIRALMDSLVAQSRPPDELVIVDGGSSDTTVSVIESYQDRLPLRVIISAGANISAGRNIAIEAAKGPIIASTDAGVKLSAGWLAALTAPFENENSPDVVSGFFQPDTETPFEIAMGATVLPELSDINPETFLPSSRSIAFKKSAWKTVGGYPEWLDFCEDLIFDLNLKAYAENFAFAPTAIAHFKPRNSLKSFFKQYYQYSRGDGKANLWLKRHIIRYATYLIGIPILLWLLFATRWLGIGAAIIAGWGMFGVPYRRLSKIWHKLSAMGKIKAALWIPIIRVMGDIAKMLGYPVGIKWRKENLPHNEALNWRKISPK